ncbi:MAG: HipA domain-containing protein [Gammaproteobacteria bacterium]
MTTELSVRLCGRPVGGLRAPTAERWSFTYDEQARHADGTAPPSLALPRSKARHEGEHVAAVFESLLPDGALRERLARSLGLPARNAFELLARVGRECHGGLTVHPPDDTAAMPPMAQRPARVLDAVELRNAMAALLIHPLLAEVDGLAKTLPGEFDKLPARLLNGQVALVLDDALTSHVIKPARPGLRESVHNEGYCMALAGAYGLPVAPTTILSGRVNVLVVERLDRCLLGGQLTALPMEDIGQALGCSPAHRYEREGGPRLAEVAALLRRVSVCPALDLRALVRWTVFSYLIGFGAGHARQLALSSGSRGPTLTPFFGLWSTHCYPEMSLRMGFSIGIEDRPDWLTAERWAECAEALGIRPRFVQDELRRAAHTLPSLAATVAEGFQRRFGYADIIGAIRTLIEQRARQALVSLATARVAVSASAGQSAKGANQHE